jgi:hypothetical protein
MSAIIGSAKSATGAPGTGRRLHAVPETVVSAEVGRDDRLVAALALAQELCARADPAGNLLPAAHHGDVVLELRWLLPAMDQATFDGHLASIDRIAAFISVAEAADAGAARAALIEDADRTLHDAVARLVDSEERQNSSLAAPRTTTSVRTG